LGQHIVDYTLNPSISGKCANSLNVSSRWALYRYVIYRRPKRGYILSPISRAKWRPNIGRTSQRLATARDASSRPETLPWCNGHYATMRMDRGIMEPNTGAKWAALRGDNGACGGILQTPNVSLNPGFTRNTRITRYSEMFALDRVFDPMHGSRIPYIGALLGTD